MYIALGWPANRMLKNYNIFYYDVMLNLFQHPVNW
jgi:hypothetical protein